MVLVIWSVPFFYWGKVMKNSVYNQLLFTFIFVFGKNKWFVICCLLAIYEIFVTVFRYKYFKICFS